MDWPILGFAIIVLGIGFLIIHFWQKSLDRTESKKAIDIILEGSDHGVHQPTGQHPIINPYLCIGCGSCISACPEEGVLGLIHGISHVINVSHCVGHGRCAEACPVQAIQIGLGNILERPDIPRLTDQLETTVPGIFIAGELGGLGLIRNAIEQGKRAMEAITERIKKLPPQRDAGVWDVLIAGAGPAGLSAGLKGVEQRIRFLIIEQDEPGGTIRKYPRRKLTLIQPVKIPLYGALHKKEYKKEELIQIWAHIIKKYQLTIQPQTQILSVKRNSHLFEVITSQGSIYCKNIILALGRRGTPRKLGVPGEQLEKVLYQLIDTASYSRNHVLVVGGGDSAVEAATGLANQPGNIVTLSYRKNSFFRLKSRNEARIKAYQESGRIKVLFSTAVKNITASDVTLSFLEEESSGHKFISPKEVTLPNDFVFVFAGGDPPFTLLKSMGIGFGEALSA